MPQDDHQGPEPEAMPAEPADDLTGLIAEMPGFHAWLATPPDDDDPGYWLWPGGSDSRRIRRLWLY